MKYGLFIIKNEEGIVLVASLVILVVLSLIAISSMQAVSLSEKISGNIELRDIAFQSAESGLRTGEACILAWRNNPADIPMFDGSDGFFTRDSSDFIDHPSSSEWWKDEVRIDDNMSDQGFDPASYIVERMATQISAASDSIVFSQLDTVGIYVVRSYAADSALLDEAKTQVRLESTFAEPDF